MADPVHQEPFLKPTDKKDLPLVKPVERKQRLPEEKLGTPDTSDQSDKRLRCLAYLKDVSLNLGRTKSKSLTLVMDAADVAGANVALFWVWSPVTVLGIGGLLPHQVRHPPAFSV